MTAGVRVELVEGLVRRVEALRRAGVARTDLRPETVLLWQGGSAGRRLVAKIADFEKAVVEGERGSMRGADGEMAEETRVPCLVISHDGVAAEGFRKVSRVCRMVGRDTAIW